jgi:hypothetical protein
MGYEIKKQWNPPNTYRVMQPGFLKGVVKSGLTRRQARELADRLNTCAKTGQHMDVCDCLECVYPNETQVLKQFMEELEAEKTEEVEKTIMTTDNATHPARVSDERLQAAKDKARLRPEYDSGRGRFDAAGPRNLEPQTEFLRQIIFEHTAPCDGQTGTAYRAAGFDNSESTEYRCWIFVPDSADGEPEIGYFCSRINLLVAQDCPHTDFIAGKFPDAEQCPVCDPKDGKIYPSNFNEELIAARAAEAMRNSARKQEASGR